MYNKWYVYLAIFIVAQFFLDGLGHVVREHITRAYKIPSGAMIQNLLIGDHVLTDKVTYLFRDPRRGDIITFPFPEDETKTFIKRIIGLPGDTIQLRDKIVYINGQQLQDAAWTQRIDPGIIDGEINSRDNFGPVTLPTDAYFVLGDNRDQSLDSRFWGDVKRDKIEGIISVIYWSWSGEGPVKEWIRGGGIGQRL